MSREILIVGSIVQDCVSYTKRFPTPGEAVHGHDFKLGTGGKGANQAVQAARLGSTVSMVACVGDDLFGGNNIKALRDSGVNVDSIKTVPDAPTAVASIYVNDDGENQIIVTLGANLKLSSEVVKAAENRIAQAAMVLSQLEIDNYANLVAFKIAKQHGVRTFLNAAPASPDMPREILKVTDILCTNENETSFILGKNLTTIEEFEAGAREILTLGPSAVVVTLGPKGVIVADASRSRTIQVPRVKAVDTTGAGDSFCGALAHLLVNHPERNLADLAVTAANIATISVQRHGTQSSYATLEEVEAAGIDI